MAMAASKHDAFAVAEKLDAQAASIAASSKTRWRAMGGIGRDGSSGGPRSVSGDPEASSPDWPATDGVGMRTAFLALGCAMLMGMTDQGPVPPAPPQPTITISPVPPRQGEKVTITYTGKLPVTLELDWDPVATPSSITIPVGGSATVTVPGNATSLIVADPTGGALPASTTVSP